MRKFGIEMEMVHGRLARQNDVINVIREAGLSRRQARSSYMESSPDEWVVKDDGSVMSGSEVVSPPLDFDDPDQRAQVTKAVEAMRSIGCQPHESAGIHVHVDVSDLSVKQVAAVVKLFFKYQDVIYRLASSGSTTIRSAARSYAPPINCARVELMAKATTMDQLYAGWHGRDHRTWSGSAPERGYNHGDSSRYCGINLMSYWYRGTIEFRVFNSSMNPDRIQAYIALCVALVEDARRGKSRSIKNALPVGSLHATQRYQGDAELKAKEARVWHRFLQILRYDAGLAIDDMRLLTACWRDSLPQRALTAA